jgi:hypothetical protein
MVPQVRVAKPEALAETAVRPELVEPEASASIRARLRRSVPNDSVKSWMSQSATSMRS